jgi:hypothetical protein
MKNRLSLALVVTSSLLAQPARADPLTTQNRLNLPKTVIAELQSGHCDLLESQYRDFKNP